MRVAHKASDQSPSSWIAVISFFDYPTVSLDKYIIICPRFCENHHTKFLSWISVKKHSLSEMWIVFSTIPNDEHTVFNCFYINQPHTSAELSSIFLLTRAVIKNWRIKADCKLYWNCQDSCCCEQIENRRSWLWVGRILLLCLTMWTKFHDYQIWNVVISQIVCRKGHLSLCIKSGFWHYAQCLVQRSRV